MNYLKDLTFAKYDAEMKKIQEKIMTIPEYQDIVNSVPQDKKLKNYYGSALNRILCMYENQILWVCKKFLKTRNIEVAVNCFDGCLIYGDFYNDTQLLDDLTKTVNKKFPNLNMEWVYKKHNDSISKYINNDTSINYVSYIVTDVISKLVSDVVNKNNDVVDKDKVVVESKIKVIIKKNKKLNVVKDTDYTKLNKIFMIPDNIQWDVTKTHKGLKATPISCKHCLVNHGLIHDEDIDHSCLFINDNDKSVIKTCFTCKDMGENL
jgi:hypothetical protein